MTMKGSIAVFAVAAAFAGNVAAVDTCRELIGAQGFMDNSPTGAWQIAQNQEGWKSGKSVNPCVIPKNRKEDFNINDSTESNLCSTYSTLMSADQKYSARGGIKKDEAWATLESYRITKLLVWYGVGKVDDTTFNAVNDAVKAAQDCIGSR